MRLSRPQSFDISDEQLFGDDVAVAPDDPAADDVAPRALGRPVSRLVVALAVVLGVVGLSSMGGGTSAPPASPSAGAVEAERPDTRARPRRTYRSESHTRARATRDRRRPMDDAPPRRRQAAVRMTEVPAAPTPAPRPPAAAQRSAVPKSTPGPPTPRAPGEFF